MMRWLKDKKKEKRSNSTGDNDGGKEDDYGFGKDKSLTKSPSSRRELPPTPATPEEKSPHIYEEIPDLHLSCMLDNEKVFMQSKFSKNKNGSTATGGTISESSCISSKPSTSEKDSVSPYMVVPVDNEVRQTPTYFHRNGTPEVHCDVIVKDTHCEILLTRKPKVGAFRLDSTALSASGQNDGDKRSVRNNTHYCSRDRRASDYVHSAGNISSAFSATLSAFSSSSTTKIHSGGTSSSITLANIAEPLETCDNNETNENGVTTYSVASNFIPRSTNLVFNPLPGKNPCKEAFGSDLSDVLPSVGYSLTTDDVFGVGGNFVPAQGHHAECLTYASIKSQDNPDHSTESCVTYASVEDQHFLDAKVKPKYSFDDLLQSQLKLKQQKTMVNSPHRNNSFGNSSRTGIIRPHSPSNSSNCIYALVTFPSETKHYNTIADISARNYPENSRGHGEGFNSDSLDVIYSSINGSFGSETGNQSPSNNESNETRKCNEVALPAKTPFNLNDARKDSKVPCFHFSDSNVDRIRFDSTSMNYTGIVGQSELKDGPNNNSCPSHDQVNRATISSEFPMLSNDCRHSLELEFCLCSDDHSSSCGCPDTKHNHDDDAASVAGATSDGPNSCRGCGRLIRQITYSESYSDETYEHVYASRLLIRSGRRFSSPDITCSQALTSEFHDIQSYRSPDFPYTCSRDDSWTSTRGSDIIPPSYSMAADSKLINKTDQMSKLKEQHSDDAPGGNNVKRESKEQLSSFNREEQVSSTAHALSCSTRNNSIAIASKHSNYSVDDESFGIQIENTSVIEDQAVEKSTVSTNFNENCKSLDEPTVDQTRKRDPAAILESKSNAFTGLLSKFSRTKSSKPAKSEPLEVSVCTTPVDRQRENDLSRCDKELEEIPEKNTKKLSKFFQRLSSKELSKNPSGSGTLPETDDTSRTLIFTDVKSSGKISVKTSLENNTASTSCQKYRWDEENSSALHTRKESGVVANSSKNSTENSEKRATIQTNIFATKSQNHVSASTHSSAFAASDQLSLENGGITDKNAPNGSSIDGANSKLQFKTDSGDTCYEYDISTSSDGEQTGYEHFLSKVKKTLNLEREVQHIAESTAVRRIRQCKRCRKEGLYSTIDNNEEGAADCDGFCPHLAEKFGDLRAIFEDLVVDQRAAILDCLTDYTPNPYNIRGHGHDSLCRECGCEILTSDSESLTTLCSLLSQQFRMTSPNGQTLSCDSDEGTMADNSCESAEDDCDDKGDNKNNINNSKNLYEDNSSGYDEPKGKVGSSSQKQRKKERREKRSHSSTGTRSGAKKPEKQGLSATLTLSTDTHEVPTTSNLCGIPTETVINTRRLQDLNEPTDSSVFSECHRKNVSRKNTSALQITPSSRQIAGLYFSHGTDLKDNSDHLKICDISRLRASFIPDKVLQDIYAPLPSKALSLLTSRNHSAPAGLSCTCGKGLQASLATVTAHLATRETITPPTVCIKGDNLKLSSARLVHCASDKMDGVVPVQKHSDREGKNSGEGELFIPSERKDTDVPKSDQHTMGVNSEKEVIANNSCSLARKNAESNDGLVSQTKPGNRTSSNKRSPVHANELSPLKNHSTSKHHDSGIKSNFRLVTTTSHQERNKSAQMSIPHTTKESVALSLTASIGVDNGSEQQYRENLSNDIYERSKTDSAKIEYTRKHRLGIVALDLLPESVVDGDTTESTRTHTILAAQPRRSKVIENMAKMFEKTNSKIAIDNIKTKTTDNSKETKNIDLETYTNKNGANNKNILHNKHICTVESQSSTFQTYTQDSLISKIAPSATNSPMSVPRSKSRLATGTALCIQSGQDNLCGRSENYNLNINENPSTSAGNDMHTITKSPRSRSGSKQSKAVETKLGCVKSENESDILKKVELKSVKGKTKSSISFLTDSRSIKERTPTSSSSSISSSCSSKKRNHAKHKLSKKSYHRKRSKHRSERNKNSNGKEERTYYYFSSDFSDIDVVEVKSCEQYTADTSAHTPHSKRTRSKQRCSSSDDIMMSFSENAQITPAQLSNHVVVDEIYCEQEIYAMPSSSSDLRSRKNSKEACASPQPSPEMAKLRKMKRTDVYKSRKSNNKLLSDLIIRNNDMQIYDNV